MATCVLRGGWPACWRGGWLELCMEHALPCPALPSPALPCPALPCPTLPCPALPCPAPPRPAPPCPALPCLRHMYMARQAWHTPCLLHTASSTVAIVIYPLPPPWIHPPPWIQPPIWIPPPPLWIQPPPWMQPCPYIYPPPPRHTHTHNPFYMMTLPPPLPPLQAAMEKAGLHDDCDACDDCMDAASKLDPSVSRPHTPPGPHPPR